jgi:spore germination protein GerM
LVRDGTVTPVPRTVEGDRPTATLEVLIAGPTAGEQAAGLRTALLTEDVIRDARVAAGVAHVDLRLLFATGTQESILAVAQLVCTLTGLPGVGQVAFTLDGQPVEVPRSDGSLTSGTVSREDYATVISAP